MTSSNPFEDIPEIISLQIKDNLEIQKRLTLNDGKFEKLLQVVEEMKRPSTATSSPQIRYSEYNLSEVEKEIRETAAEHVLLKEKLNSSTVLLRNLAARVEDVDQYLKRENLFFNFKGHINIPRHLKGYKFSMWLAKTINNLIPKLDFPILPRFISVSHPLSPKSNVVIARFAVRDVRNEIFYKKQYVVDPNVEITEHLTAQNQHLLDTAQKRLGTNNAWSSQTKLYGKVGREVVRIKAMDDIDLLQGMKCMYEQIPLETTVHQPGIAAIPIVAENPVSTPSMNPDLNLNPIHELEEVERNWPHLSQSDIITAINNFVSQRGTAKRQPFNKRRRIHNFRGPLSRAKRYIIPPPIHRSYNYK